MENKKANEDKFIFDKTQVPSVTDQRNDSFIGVLKAYSELKDLQKLIYGYKHNTTVTKYLELSNIENCI